jgi:hypothetical protein
VARSKKLPNPLNVAGHGIEMGAKVDDDLVLVGIDLDTCRDDKGRMAPWAQEIVDRVNAYTEVSPSETGYKIFFLLTTADRDAILAKIRALNPAGKTEGIKWARGGGKHPPAIELFLGKRFFTVTDRPSNGADLRVVDAETINWIIDDAGPAFKGNGHDDNGARDGSRSGAAFALAGRMKRAGRTFEQFNEAVHADPETAEWASDKGDRYNGREIRRAWERVKVDWERPRFQIIGGALHYLKYEWDGTVTKVKLANFAARIVEDQVIDDGATETRRYRIAGAIEDETELPDALVDAEMIGSPKWVNRCWGARAIVTTGLGVAMLEEAIKAMSAGVLERRIYAHLGWRRVNCEWIYLHAGGAIGKDGAVTDVSVEIAGALSHCVLPDGVGDIGAAVRASLLLIDIGPFGTAVAAAAYRAPLGEMSANTLTVHGAGQTGSFKSVICGIAQAHWGSYWDGVLFPANWTDTAYDLERKAFIAKDTLFGADDFKPRGNARYHVEELHAKAEHLIRAQGNQSGRGRLGTDLKERPTYWPRGITLMSGEDVPPGHSLRARMMIAQVKKSDHSVPLLTELQGFAKRGLLAQAMAGYVRWIATRWDDIKASITTKREELRRDVTVSHARTATNFADLMIGVETFLQFAVKAGAITAEEAATRSEMADRNLRALLAAQDQEQRDENPVEVFLDALGEVLATGRAHIAEWMMKGMPEWQPQSCGWRELRVVEVTDALGEKTGEKKLVGRAMGDLIGWVHGEKLYVLLDTACAAVERLLGRPIGVSSKTLLARLAEAGEIVDRDAGKNTKRVSTDNRKLRVIALKADRVLIAEASARLGEPIVDDTVDI